LHWAISRFCCSSNSRRSPNGNVSLASRVSPNVNFDGGLP
jgi:hypothetical protein